MTQAEALDIMKTGANVFVTGAAGSGKTHLLREYISWLQANGAGVGITASTGIAATHMNGMTIHSWSGFWMKDRWTESDLKMIAGKRLYASRIRAADVLVIDEISMLHKHQFDSVDRILRAIKNPFMPFGGIQVILCGDFFQLPPVARRDEPPAEFAYEAEAWRELDLRICYLEEQHRQDDLPFLKVLNAIRDDKVSPEMHRHLKGFIGKKAEHPAKPTRLYTHNADVDKENELELARLPEKMYEYRMSSYGVEKICDTLKKGCLSPEVLRLKKGARVMFTKNDFEEGYVNGTLGEVESCDEHGITVRTWDGKKIAVGRESWRVEEDGKIKGEVIQYPLRLAWAITVHKSQGMSLDAAEVDLSRTFEKGMGYVALSRLRSLKGLSLKGMNELALKVRDDVLAYDGTFREMSAEDAARVRAMPKAEKEGLHAAFLRRVGGKVSKEKKEKVDTVMVTLEMFKKGASVREIAQARDLTAQTVIGHLQKILDKDPFFDFSRLKSEFEPGRLEKILAAFRAVGPGEGGRYRATSVRELLGGDFTYDEIGLAKLFL